MFNGNTYMITANGAILWSRTDREHNRLFTRCWYRPGNVRVYHCIAWEEL